MSELWDPDFDEQVTLPKEDKPASRWRNAYWAPGGVWADGDTTNPFYASKRFASRDEAETNAEAYLASLRPCEGRPFYIGAFPVVEGDA